MIKRRPGPVRLFSAFALAVPLVLAACTPALDWREVRNSDAGYSATFPGKPAMATREFVMAGHSVSLRLQAATSGDAYFAIGEIPLSEQLQPNAPEILQALKASLHNNIGAQQAHEKTVNVSGVVWQEVRATGKLRDGAPAVLAGRFVIQAGRILEVVVMGPASQLTDDVVDQWLGSVKLGGGA